MTGPARQPPARVLCVGAVVLREDGRVLWVRQARGHPLEEKWSIPWGVVDEGEPPALAAAREALEEAGVHVEVHALDEPFEPWCEWLVRRVMNGKHHVVPEQADHPFAPHRAFL